jgi:hypothetical protein
MPLRAAAGDRGRTNDPDDDEGDDGGKGFRRVNGLLDNDDVVVVVTGDSLAGGNVLDDVDEPDIGGNLLNLLAGLLLPLLLLLG